MFRSEPLGSPGVYTRQAEPAKVLSSERMDVCAFVGIAPRGPSRKASLPEWWCEENGSYMSQWQSGIFNTKRSIAVPVESFAEYRRLFGGFNGPGRLPYAVAAFFENGGRRAYIIRIVHEYNNRLINNAAVATGNIENVTLSTGVTLKLLARDEGVWGNKIRAALGFTLGPITFESADVNGLVLHKHNKLPIGTLLRCHLPGARPELRFVLDSRSAVIDGERKQRIEFSLPLSVSATFVEVVEGDLLLDDGELIRERYTGLGLNPLHPRWIAKELCYRSEIVYPDSVWHNAEIVPIDQDKLPYAAILPELEKEQFTQGQDRYDELIHQDFFDKTWSSAEYEAGDGVHAIANNIEIASVTIPDLYCPDPLPDTSDEPVVVSLAGDEFSKCIDIEPDAETVFEWPEINQLCLDPALAVDRDQIISLQQQFVDFANVQLSWVALLDVPPRLRLHQTMAWREQFNSSYAAAYSPWLHIARADDQRNKYIELNPAAVAAGIIAAREISHGVHYGPANKRAIGVVALNNPVTPVKHDQLHQSGINVYISEPGGFRLSAARTLSNNSQYRQLSVRRLMILIKRMLTKQTQWAVFENNGPPLWRELSRMLENFLLQLYRAGAFLGASSQEAFYVRCNEQTNTQAMQDRGRLIAEIGIAPAEPMEFIVLRITLEGDGSTVKEI